MNARLISFWIGLCGPLLAAEPHPVSSRQLYTDARTGLTIVGGTVALPASGHWELAEVPPDGRLREVRLLPPASVLTRTEGTRLNRLNDRRAVQAAQQQLHALFWACRQYAEEHGGLGPAELEELNPNQLDWVRQHGALANVALLPGVKTPPPTQPTPSLDERVPLAFEVRPKINDGRHWVLWNDGQVERALIDTQRLAAYGLAVRPRGAPRDAPSAAPDDTFEYRLLARRSADFNAPVGLTLRDRLSDRKLEVRWEPGRTQPGGVELLADWARPRVADWRAMADPASATVLGWWLRQAPALYGLEPAEPDNRVPRTPGNRTTVFNVLGGRAAIQETLQLQNLDDPIATRPDEASTLPIARIPGVQVKAHDYAARLGGDPGGRIALADLVPPDRLFAWFPRPAMLAGFLDEGTDFLFGLSSEVTGSRLEYGLTDRYLARLGLNEPLLRSLLESGALTEVAVVLPDLHFIDGTDLTVIARLGEPVLVTGALRLLGLGDLAEPVTRTLPAGEAVHWLKRGDLLMLGSSRGELERILDLAENAGEGSLGRSAEFRYMLTQLEPRETTRAFVYLSDPFIRRLTGPAAKIGQLRRLTARAQLEALTAGALLHSLDHEGAPATAAALFETGYAPRLGGFTPAEFVMDEQGAAHSEAFGPPARMKTLLDRPVERVTPAEAKAYELYRENYERFWRQFFDPIAIRLDQTRADRWELETFILPLIDNSIYSGLRRGVASAESRVPLKVPGLEPQPVGMLSANLTDATWVEALDDLDDLLVRVLGHESGVLDQLGPGLHFAVGDSDPVLSLGSGDLLGLFGGAGPGLNNELFFIPAAVSLFTRPSALLIELKDPQAVVRELSRLPTGAREIDSGFLGLSSAWYRVTDENAWIYSLSLGQVMKLRFGLTVQGRYLVVSNQPLTYRPRVVAESAAPNNGLGLELRPEAAALLGSSLRLAAMEQQREAARAGCALLHPLLLGGAGSVEEATRRHQAWFGFAPLHPPGGIFEWRDGVVSSTLFGRPGAEQQPAFDLEESGTALLRRVRELRVSLQFEQDGLRVVTNWSVRP